MPLLNQGKLIGVLYLENDLTPHVFTSARLAVLKLLASQAAISLENAGLYRDLKEREAKIRRLVDSNIIGIFIWDFEGQILEANEAFLHMVGYDREELVGGRIRWTDLTPPDWRDRDARLIQEHKMTGTLRPAEKEYFRKDGSRVPVLIGAATFEECEKRGVAFVLDLTERKCAEEALRASEEALRRNEAWLTEAQRLSHTGTWVLNPTTMQYLYWSDESYRIWGFDPLQGLPTRDALWQRIHDRDKVWEEVQEALRQKKDYSGEFKIVLPNGTVKYLAATSHHLFSTNGDLVEVIGTNVDVTERARAEQALRESEAKFRDYAETASDWFWEIGPDYKFTLLTENAYGSGAADRIGTACWDHALDLETEPEKWRLVRATLDSRHPFRDFVYCSEGDNSSPIYVKASGKPVFGANGEFRGYRGTATDVTASMRAQEEHERLRELESHLAHMNRVSVMGELAASLVHEITQPIATARNNARAAMHFLDRSPPDLGEVREALACLVDDTDRAGKIIDGVRGHVKKAPLRKERFDLNDAIKDVIVLARTAIIKNGVAVRARLAEAPLIIEGDCVQLQQVALNLILNAIEAMSSVKTGARDLLISTEQSQPDEVLVSVRDSGPGIDPKNLERVFETFYTTKSRGIGMGLSISRSIVAAHGGCLWADANVPRGAVFSFTLRRAAKDSGILLERLAGPERRAKALQQTRLVDGLLKAADDPIVERAGSVDVVDVGRDEDRRNRVSGTDEVSVEVDSGHSRHLDVGNQAGGFNQAMGCKEIGGRSESLDGVAQRPHEPSHGLAKELIIIDDRDQ
jgi:PAS domain S-box-containing protein